MTSGPVEILTLVFPENNFVGAILPELAKLVESGTITVIDGLAVKVDEAGEETYFEFDEVGESPELASLSSLVARVDGLISDEDVHELTSAMGPNSTAAILVFEHTWANPLASAVREAGGVLLDSTRVPGAVVDEVLAALSELDEKE
ncbi:MAG: hypothetical protein JWP10_286 [Nocardioidaceae bacterium]|nr:hypothetical protein [Nocardioidaceae bacterium]